jgi:diphthine synthase
MTIHITIRWLILKVENKEMGEKLKLLLLDVRMLYLIGLGLGDEKDITLRGLEAARECELLFLDAYTSLLVNASTLSDIGSKLRHPSVPLHQLLDDYLCKLERLFNKPITIADRNILESQVDQLILHPALERHVAILVVGDPLSATTHTDLILRANQSHVPFKIIHNASIINAIGATGLQLYRFGQTVSLVYFTDSWKPSSFYDKIKQNQLLGLHTLCLLDIQMAERTIEALIKDQPVYEPPRFMLLNEALQQLLEVEETRKEGVYNPDTLVVGVARLGADNQKIVSGSIRDLLTVDWGNPLHSLVIPGHVHPLEQDFLKLYLYKSPPLS